MHEQMHMLRARFPESVVNYLSARAKDDDRSMNAELLNILKKAMKAEPVSRVTCSRSCSHQQLPPWSPALLPEPRDEDQDRAALGPGGHA